ncbi:MAG: glycosyltransferase family 1 protein [bacterium]
MYVRGSVPTIEALAIANRDDRLLGLPARMWLHRPFGRHARSRVLIYGEPGAISRSQIEPFFYHAASFQDRFGAQFRCRPVADFLHGRAGPEADIVLVQPWFTVSGEVIARGFEMLRARLPNARFVFIDSYAHNDLRLGRFVDPYIDLYFKKSIFRNRGDYLLPQRGDTNLTAYYGKLYDIQMGAPVDWQVPESILPKLRLSPNFFTHARFVRAFQSSTMPPWEGRRIDVQSRLGEKGSSWYAAMRKDAQRKLEAIPGLTLSQPGKLDIQAFMEELTHSRLCFSPFGYGELCWRDIEAFQTGAVLIKPDMSHLVTLPDLYVPGITYLPVHWDFSDLYDVVRSALRDARRMEAIAHEAYARISQYIREGRFVDNMAEIWGLPENCLPSDALAM